MITADAPSLDTARLENVHRVNGNLIARCPACAEAGADGSGEHLSIDAQGRFCCVANPGPEGNAHRRRIFELAGIKSDAPAPQPTRKTAKGKKTHRTIDDAVRAAAWGAGRKKGDKWTPTRRDVYDDAEGNAVAAEVRMDRADGAVDDLGKPIKTFCTMHAVKNGWRLGDPPGKWPPHNLPAVLASKDTVFIPEGPKSVEAAASIGLTATTSAYGKDNSKKTDWTPLHGRDVVILPDNDPDGGGMKYAEAVAELVHAAGARSIKIVELPDLPPKGDLVDFIAARADR